MANKLNKHHLAIAGGLLAIIFAIIKLRQMHLSAERPEPRELKDFSEDIIPGSGVISTPGTKNFKLKEFRCKDGTDVPAEYYGNVQDLMNQLQVLRDHLRVPILINSGYRTKAHNRKVGGAASSSHLTAKAADIRTSSHTPAQIYAKIEELIGLGLMKQGGLSKYSTFVHYDVRGYKSRW